MSLQTDSNRARAKRKAAQPDVPIAEMLDWLAARRHGSLPGSVDDRMLAAAIAWVEYSRDGTEYLYTELEMGEALLDAEQAGRRDGYIAGYFAGRNGLTSRYAR